MVPRHETGHGQEQGVEAGIVEPLPDEPTRCQQYLAGDVRGGPRQSGLERLPAYAAPEHDHTRTDCAKPAGKGFQVIDPFGQNERSTTRSNAPTHIGADRRIASVILRQVLANALILDAEVAIGIAGPARRRCRRTARRDRRSPTSNVRAPRALPAWCRSTDRRMRRPPRSCRRSPRPGDDRSHRAASGRRPT